ncbi:unnamed protein product, partial [Sphacelaria rigidula]
HICYFHRICPFLNSLSLTVPLPTHPVTPCSSAPAQFEPYLFFGCDLKSRFNGTLFRFPLRMAAAARDSEISQASYSAKSVVELLDQFKEAANRSVLSSCFVSVI